MNATSSTNSEITAIHLFPRAGRLRGKSTVYSRIIGVMRGHGLRFETTTQAELDQACVSMFETRPVRVVVLGGDGSLMRTLSALRRVYGEVPLPRIVLIPVGTVNLTATRFGIHGRPEVLLEKALNTAPSRIESTPSLKVTLDEKEYLAFTFGTGLISHFFEAYEAEPKQGKSVAAKIFFKTFFGSLVRSAYARRMLSPTHGRLVLGARDFGALDLTLLVTSVFRELGLGLKPTYRAGTVPGQLHVVGSTLAAHRLGPLALRVLRGKPLSNHAHFPDVIDEMSEQFCLMLAQTTDVVLDGDPIPAHRVVVTVGPQLSFERY